MSRKSESKFSENCLLVSSLSFFTLTPNSSFKNDAPSFGCGIIPATLLGCLHHPSSRQSSGIIPEERSGRWSELMLKEGRLKQCPLGVAGLRTSRQLWVSAQDQGNEHSSTAGRETFKPLTHNWGTFGNWWLLREAESFFKGWSHW